MRDRIQVSVSTKGYAHREGVEAVAKYLCENHSADDSVLWDGTDAEYKQAIRDAANKLIHTYAEAVSVALHGA